MSHWVNNRCMRSAQNRVWSHRLLLWRRWLPARLSWAPAARILLHSQPSSFPPAGKSCQPVKDLGEWRIGALHQQTFPSVCTAVGMDRIVPGIWPGGNRNRGLFPDSCSHPARMGEEGNLSQFIYLFTVFKAASCGIRYRSPTGGSLHMDSDT